MYMISVTRQGADPRRRVVWRLTSAIEDPIRMVITEVRILRQQHRRVSENISGGC
jgi:hypothetical protein